MKESDWVFGEELLMSDLNIKIMPAHLQVMFQTILRILGKTGMIFSSCFDCRKTNPIYIKFWC